MFKLENMMSHVKFNFRNKICNCDFVIDSSAYPGYIFTFLTDDELIADFTEDVTIKTDFEKILPKKDDYTELVVLRQAIFNAIAPLQEFADAKQKISLITSNPQKQYLV